MWPQTPGRARGRGRGTSQGDQMDDVIVETMDGAVRGAVDQGVATFKGLRYAAPPLGERRFAAPAPVEAWDGVRAAPAFGPSCPQPETRPDGWVGEASTDEDCLFLNVFTPAADDARRPVMVWFHGGGYTIGSGSWPLYDGTNLARRGDVVVVTVNHRLGILGYLQLAHLDEAERAAGNAGTLDLVASLEWVRDNIARFGGDPGNVTIFGESGGGAKVCSMLAMPAARGLFHRGVVQSGAMQYLRTPDVAAALTDKVLGEVGLAPENAVAELRSLPADALLVAQQAVSGGSRDPMGGDAPVWMYLFTWAAGPMRSGHGYELPFVFDNVHDPVLHPSPSRQQLADRMAEAWVAVARSGDPNHDGLDDWPAYDLHARPTMLFDRGTCRVEDDPWGTERLAWK